MDFMWDLYGFHGIYMDLYGFISELQGWQSRILYWRKFLAGEIVEQNGGRNKNYNVPPRTIGYLAKNKDNWVFIFYL